MKMKRMRSFFALMVVFVMLFGTMITAIAEERSPIKPGPEELGSITIHKEGITDPDGYGEPGNGADQQSMVQMVTGPLNGVVFELYMFVLDSSDDPISAGAGVKYALSGNSTDGFRCIVTKPDGTTVTYDLIPKGYQVTSNSVKDLANSYDEDTFFSGAARFEDLEQGYYLVIENLNHADSNPVSAFDSDEHADILLPMAPFVVSIPYSVSYYPNIPNWNDAWLLNVHVYPKNLTDIPAEKISDIESVDVGDEVNYYIYTVVPNKIGSALAFEIKDEMDSALTYVPGSLKFLDPYDYEIPYDLVLGTHYMIDADELQNNNTLLIEFTQAGLDKLAEDEIEELLLTFAATVNELILEKESNIVENIATFTFINEHGQEVVWDTDPSEIYTGQIRLEKVDSELAPLEGAQFKIADSVENALDGLFLRKDNDGNIYRPADPDYYNYNDWVVTSTLFTDDDENEFAYVHFNGLKVLEYIYDDEDGSFISAEYLTYYIVETKAPVGYNLYGEIIEITFDNSADETNGYLMEGEVQIVNTDKFILPETGGNGTMWFTVAGITLIGCAVLMVLSSKKKQRV